jgi:serine protease
LRHVALLSILLLCACRPAQRVGGGAAPQARALSMVESRTTSWALDRLDAREFELDSVYRRSGTGAGVTVYVFDSGIAADHPELQGRVRAGFVADVRDAKTCTAHGTAVAGAIAGKTLGVASGAEIVDVRVLGCDAGLGTVDAIARATRWVIDDHKQRGGPAVANWSFFASTLRANPLLDESIARLRSAGITVVAAAGNLEVDACRTAPAKTQGIVMVGAVGPKSGAPANASPHDWRAEGTAWGRCIDVYAPGVDVELPGFDRQGRAEVQRWTGTSMAAGYASGTAALFLQMKPQAQPAAVEKWLTGSGTPDLVYDARTPGARVLFAGIQQTVTVVAVKNQ